MQINFKKDDLDFSKKSLLYLLDFYISSNKDKIKIIDLLFNNPNYTYDEIENIMKSKGYNISRNSISQIKKQLEIPKILKMYNRNYIIEEEIKEFYYSISSSDLKL